MLDKNEIERIKNTSVIRLKDGEEAVNLIFSHLRDIKNSFCSIGFWLKKIVELEYYAKFGYDNIADFSEHVFGIKKSTTYDLIAIANFYCDGQFLKDEYKDFNQSQLVEMSRIKTTLSSKITPEMSVSDIRDLKKALPNYSTFYKGIYYDKPFEIIKAYRKDQEEKFQTSGKEEVKVDDVKDKPIQVEEPKQPITDKDVSDCLKNIDKLIKPDRKVRLERLMAKRAYFKDTVSALLEKKYNSYYVEVKMGARKQNLSVFLECLCGNVYDIIEELIKC